MSLACLSHQFPAAPPYVPESAALFSVGHPQRTYEYAYGALGRKPCIFRHLRRLATRTGEKGRLAALRIAVLLPLLWRLPVWALLPVPLLLFVGRVGLAWRLALVLWPAVVGWSWLALPVPPWGRGLPVLASLVFRGGQAVGFVGCCLARASSVA